MVIPFPVLVCVPLKSRVCIALARLPAGRAVQEAILSVRSSTGADASGSNGACGTCSSTFGRSQIGTACSTGGLSL